jgi:hypothetical protein
VLLTRIGSGIQLVSVNPGNFVEFTSRGLSNNTLQIVLTNMTGSPSYRVQTTLGGGVLSDKL